MSLSAVTRIGIVDDHSVVLEGIQAVFSDYPDVRVIGKAHNTRGALELVKAQDPDVLILDLQLGHESAVDVLDRLAFYAPKTKVVIFSAYPVSQYGAALHSLGAKAFVDKSGPVEDLIEIVRLVAAGHILLAPDIVDDGPTSPPHLTKRELQIFLKLAGGTTVTQTALELNLARNSVSYYKTRLMRKFGFTNSQQLTKYAIDNGFLHAPCM